MGIVYFPFGKCRRHRYAIMACHAVVEMIGKAKGMPLISLDLLSRRDQFQGKALEFWGITESAQCVINGILIEL